MAIAPPPSTGVTGRGLVPDLPTSAPLAPTLPALLQEDGFVDRLMVAFDEALAPILSTLDCLDAYLDPALAPDDFVEWLAGWVAVDIDQTWSSERRRRLVADAARLYRLRGTAAGLVDHLELYAGVSPEISESGGCGWSSTADSPLPGSAEPHLTVRLRVEGEEAVKVTTVERIVAASRPAHLPFEVEVRSDAGELEAPHTHLSLTLEGEIIEVAGDPDDGGVPVVGASSLGSDAGDDAATVAATGPVTRAAGPVAPPGSERIDLAPAGPQLEEEVEEFPDVPLGEGEDPQP